MWQTAIDAIGKLGPLAVAVAVFLTNRAQTRWANLVARRAAALDDQRFRLALLDRRAEAIEKIRFALAGFWREGAVKQEAVIAIGEALRIAELVFEDAERAMIEGLLQGTWNWQTLNRRLNAYRERGDVEKLHAIVDEICAFEDELEGRFTPLLRALQEATQIRAPAPVPDASARSLLAFIRRH